MTDKTRMTAQLALHWPAREDFSADSLIEGPSNSAALAALSRWQSWPKHVLALTGPEGAGKSHIAAIWARDTAAATLRASTLADRLTSLPQGHCLVVEDVDRGCDDDALFHVLNRAAKGEIPGLLLTARSTPVLWPARLPDLVSRLRALPHTPIAEPDDEVLTQLIEKQLRDRGAPIRPGVIEYLLPRMERSVSAVRVLVDRLDKLALVKKTPITRAVAREVLSEWGEGREAEGDIA
ncbi:P-loop NTPase family protein [Maricaulis sp. CAU 1757]